MGQRVLVARIGQFRTHANPLDDQTHRFPEGDRPLVLAGHGQKDARHDPLKIALPNVIVETAPVSSPP